MSMLQAGGDMIELASLLTDMQTDKDDVPQVYALCVDAKPRFEKIAAERQAPINWLTTEVIQRCHSVLNSLAGTGGGELLASLSSPLSLGGLVGGAISASNTSTCILSDVL